MRRIATLLVTFARDERGVTAIEYCLIATLIAVAAVTTFTQAGGKLGDLNGRVLDALR